MWVRIKGGGVCVSRPIVNSLWKRTQSRHAGLYNGGVPERSYKQILKNLGL